MPISRSVLWGEGNAPVPIAPLPCPSNSHHRMAGLSYRVQKTLKIGRGERLVNPTVNQRYVPL